jgi:hypothetical protein
MAATCNARGGRSSSANLHIDTHLGGGDHGIDGGPVVGAVQQHRPELGPLKQQDLTCQGTRKGRGCSGVGRGWRQRTVSKSSRGVQTEKCITPHYRKKRGGRERDGASHPTNNNHSTPYFASARPRPIPTNMVTHPHTHTRIATTAAHMHTHRCWCRLGRARPRSSSGTCSPGGPASGSR